MVAASASFDSHKCLVPRNDLLFRVLTHLLLPTLHWSPSTLSVPLIPGYGHLVQEVHLFQVWHPAPRV